MLELYISPQSDWHEDWFGFDISLLNFTWRTVSYRVDLITFDLIFNSPETISPFKKYDKLILHVLDPVYFKNKDGVELSTKVMDVEVEPMEWRVSENIPMYGDLIFSMVIAGGSLSLVVSGGFLLIAGLVNGM